MSHTHFGTFFTYDVTFQYKETIGSIKTKVAFVKSSNIKRSENFHWLERDFSKLNCWNRKKKIFHSCTSLQKLRHDRTIVKVYNIHILHIYKLSYYAIYNISVFRLNLNFASCTYSSFYILWDLQVIASRRKCGSGDVETDGRVETSYRSTVIPAVFSGSVASGIAVPRAHCLHEIRSRKERKLCPSTVRNALFPSSAGAFAFLHLFLFLALSPSFSLRAIERTGKQQRMFAFAMSRKDRRLNVRERS